MNSIKKNLIYNWIYQIVIVISPIITVPYIARILGAEGQGIYSYTYSIARCFWLIGIMGLTDYGNRVIAQNKDNKEKLSQEFSSIYVIQLITSILSILMYIVFIVFFNTQYKIYHELQILFVLAIVFDVSWFFYGIEKFKLITISNIIVKILSIISIFVFVKNTTDLVNYIIVMGLTTLLLNLILWINLRKEIKFKMPKWDSIKKHIKPNLIFFIAVITSNIYYSIEKILLGYIGSIEELRIL